MKQLVFEKIINGNFVTLKLDNRIAPTKLILEIDKVIFKDHIEPLEILVKEYKIKEKQVK